MKFRTLRADEIECRVAVAKDTGISLLLYKDARCDMNILDEEVGKMNWQRSHSRENANCIVSIWDSGKGQWISKEDTGTESFTEKEKGLASDSFKRACFNWGIGRELYTAPFIWIPSSKCKITPKAGGRGYACYDHFSVESIGFDDKRNINELKIRNKDSEEVVFVFGENRQEDPAEPQPIKEHNVETIEPQISKENSAESIKPQDGGGMITRGQVRTLEKCIPKHRQTVQNVCRHYKVQWLHELTVEQFMELMNRMGEQ